MIFHLFLTSKNSILLPSEFLNMSKVNPFQKSILKKKSSYSIAFNSYGGKIDQLWNIHTPINEKTQKKKMKKSVRFSPSTTNFERETKTIKYHEMFKRDSLGKFPVQIRKNQFDAFLRNGQKVDIGDDPDPETAVSNAYIHFTHAKRLPPDPLRKNSESLDRSRRLFALLQQLESCHNEYNNLEVENGGIENQNRDKCLIKILTLYILAVDLSLTEGCYGITLGLLTTITDTTASMLPLYSHIFYNLDGSYRPLPEPLPQQTSSYLPTMTPIIYALNRISENRSQKDNVALNMETLLTKLQLELILLTIVPIESILFRTVLEIVPSTAGVVVENLKSLLSSSSKLWIKWVNNSNLRNDYVGILKKARLDHEKLGSRAVKSNHLESSDQNNNVQV